MIKLTEFTKAWGETEKTISRLETLPEYDVSGDREVFELWKKGKPFTQELHAWFLMLEKARLNGIKIQRLRVVRKPVNEYLRYELAFWEESAKHGEEFYFIDEQEYLKMIGEMGFIAKDNWMFDDKKVVEFKYSKGELKSESLVRDKNLIGKYKELKERLMGKAVKREEFFR